MRARRSIQRPWKIRSVTTGPGRVLAVVAATGLLAGCHQYRAVSVAEPPAPGAPVRVSYAESFPDPISGAPINRLASLEGTLVAWDDREIRVAVRRAAAHPSVATTGRPDTLAIAADRISSVDRREVRWRRVAVVGAIGAVVVPIMVKLAFDWARGSVDAGENGDPTPPP